ncbi:MAG: hypothetical protein JXO48_05750 [Deltaproteobacteria bacterium]|nr:hypothetical protein [Deltaproteobacteria bacterium]
MKVFEYRITRHPAEELREMVIFCSERGECGLGDVPQDQVVRLQNILNETGRDGWELIDTVFGRDGLLAFWKREK